MSTKYIVRSAPIVIGLFALIPLLSFNSGNGISSAQGQASSCGSPGEPGTCSRSTCHGAGSGGLADNAGPGSVILTAVPALVGTNYKPGQLYHMTVTVSETGKTHFGFGVEILDNTGNTDTHVNNTAGVFTVTDAVNTRTWQAFGTGRLAFTHNTNGGLASNTCSFIFDWTAPASGTINMYLAGNATNNNGAADAADNVYTLQKSYTPLVTGISEQSGQKFEVSTYPNPANSVIHFSANIPQSARLQAGLYNSLGMLVRSFDDKELISGNYQSDYSLAGIAKGIYFLKSSCGEELICKTIIVE
jgi:hypothetical protein